MMRDGDEVEFEKKLTIRRHVIREKRFDIYVVLSK